MPNAIKTAKKQRKHSPKTASKILAKPSNNGDSYSSASTDDVNNKHQPHTPNQDLTHFGTWVGKPIWVPPKDNSDELAKSLLNRFGPFASKSECWQYVTRKHRDKFTQVRRLELPKASIRLPQGQVYVTVTEQDRFDEIEEPIPSCVQTRLDEFLAGPGKRRGVKVYYLKPLCIEVGSDLIFTTKKELDDAISQIQSEVFSQYRRKYAGHLARQVAVGALDAALFLPRSIMTHVISQKKREIESFHAKLEFERRKRAHKAMRQRKKYRKDECTFDEILALTETPDREDVIEHYVKDKALRAAEREMFLLASATTLPWFAALSLVALKIATVSVATSVSVAVCDPAFVAEVPNADGKLLKIGHFDEVDGIMHVEI